jgi:hypothetical protein
VSGAESHRRNQHDARLSSLLRPFALLRSEPCFAGCGFVALARRQHDKHGFNVSMCAVDAAQAMQEATFREASPVVEPSHIAQGVYLCGSRESASVRAGWIARKPRAFVIGDGHGLRSLSCYGCVTVTSHKANAGTGGHKGHAPVWTCDRLTAWVFVKPAAFVIGDGHEQNYDSVSLNFRPLRAETSE